jgi:hypothetical protein
MLLHESYQVTLTEHIGRLGHFLSYIYAMNSDIFTLFYGR